MSPDLNWTVEHTGQTGEVQRHGERAPLPKDAVVSITHSIGLRFGSQTRLNSLFSNWFIPPGLPRNENLLSTELLHRHFQSGESPAITPRCDKAMPRFHDMSGHSGKGPL